MSGLWGFLGEHCSLKKKKIIIYFIVKSFGLYLFYMAQRDSHALCTLSYKKCSIQQQKVHSDGHCVLFFLEHLLMTTKNSVQQTRHMGMSVAFHIFVQRVKWFSSEGRKSEMGKQIFFFSEWNARACTEFHQCLLWPFTPNHKSTWEKIKWVVFIHQPSTQG